MQVCQSVLKIWGASKDKNHMFFFQRKEWETSGTLKEFNLSQGTLRSTLQFLSLLPGPQVRSCLWNPLLLPPLPFAFGNVYCWSCFHPGYISFPLQDLSSSVLVNEYFYSLLRSSVHSPSRSAHLGWGPLWGPLHFLAKVPPLPWYLSGLEVGFILTVSYTLALDPHRPLDLFSHFIPKWITNKSWDLWIGFLLFFLMRVSHVLPSPGDVVSWTFFWNLHSRSASDCMYSSRPK